MEDVCDLTQFSQSTIRRLVKTGRIPFLQLSGKRGHLRFPLDLIEQLLQQQTRVLPPQENIEQASVMTGKRLAGRKPKWTDSSLTDS